MATYFSVTGDILRCSLPHPSYSGLFPLNSPTFPVPLAWHTVSEACTCHTGNHFSYTGRVACCWRLWGYCFSPFYVSLSMVYLCERPTRPLPTIWWKAVPCFYTVSVLCHHRYPHTHHRGGGGRILPYLLTGLILCGWWRLLLILICLTFFCQSNSLCVTCSERRPPCLNMYTPGDCWEEGMPETFPSHLFQAIVSLLPTVEEGKLLLTNMDDLVDRPAMTTTAFQAGCGRLTCLPVLFTFFACCCCIVV